MDDQAASLRRKVEMNSQPREAKTISIISGKGGVGKSNIALNISLELMNQDKKVILFDLDVGMGNINILLGLQPRKSIVDLLNEELSIFDIIEQGPRNLSYIAGGTGLSSFFTLDAPKKNHFFEQYNELVHLYDYIIFDMGAGVTVDSLFFILASDECIVITTPEPTSITDAYSMIKQVVTNGYDMPIHVILNRARSQKEGMQALKRFQQVVTQFLQIHINLMGIIPEDQIVSEAVRKQTPYVILNEKSRAARAIRELTINYIKSTKQMNNIRTFSFIQRLKKFIVR